MTSSVRTVPWSLPLRLCHAAIAVVLVTALLLKSTQESEFNSPQIDLHNSKQHRRYVPEEHMTYELAGSNSGQTWSTAEPPEVDKYGYVLTYYDAIVVIDENIQLMYCQFTLDSHEKVVPYYQHLQMSKLNSTLCVECQECFNFGMSCVHHYVLPDQECT